MQLKGCAAIVTGGGTGVGKATALALAKRGCAVAINYSKSKDEAEETAELVRAQGVKSLAMRADVASDEDCREFVDRAVAEFGRLDLLCNNAGTTVFVDHKDMDALNTDDWDRVFAVNVRGAFQMIRAARIALADGDGGEVVNTTSVAGTHGIGSSIPYCASKAAMNNLTLTTARALAPKIRVNAVAPGFITGRWLKSGYGENYEAVRDYAASRAALGKVCDPEDVANTILGLVEGPDLVTGQVLILDGGLTIGGM
ncbi:MAG: 3-oxoacyl-[acyl-carrier protein] reductase [Hyphomicrobiaceae bacterium]|jgi:3-oxoacyl-[acyl-carrier protein] reductase